MDTNEYNRIYYEDIFSSDSDGYYRAMSTKITKALAMFGKMEGKKILDVGCADGVITAKIGHSTGAEMYGVDINKTALDVAKKNGIKTRQCNIEKDGLPFADSFFDAVFCGDVVEHVFDTEMLLSEVRRVLRPEGFIVMSVPNVAAWYNRIIINLGFLPVWIESGSTHSVGTPFIKTSMGHVKAFTKRSAAGLLSIMGFRVLHITGSPVFTYDKYNPTLGGIWNGADRVFSKFPSLSSLIVIKAEKAKL
jgi:2-polyprenyl-3-methyl-5-hydroxy-6-metoxy-1,4-benzoquinol methylase